MKSSEELKEHIRRIDRRGYPAYKELRGEYRFPGFVLNIEHVQGDPFASPSKISLFVKGDKAGFPKHLYTTPWRRLALQDELLRQFGRQTEKLAFKAKGSGKSGLLSVSRCHQEILERSGCEIHPENGSVLVRMEVGLPANGRSVNGREALKIFEEYIPLCVNKTLYYSALRPEALDSVYKLADDQQCLRETLPKLGLCAFVADGALLPRASGVSQQPLKEGKPFQSPESLRVTIELPHRGEISGMGIPKGVTLIVGGGYHGKSTLLEALERGVYNHIMGDGREYVITDDSAVKIRAEDGRSIQGVDISMFIDGLPGGKDTRAFETENASGSTSQAAGVTEAIEADSRLLLIDEDTSATNFMIRDELMQQVVHRDWEPITPYIDRIREIYDSLGVSTILVAGSSGAYFHKADVIIQMKEYVPEDITAYAKEKAAAFPMVPAAPAAFEISGFERIPMRRGKSSERNKMKVFGMDSIQINRDTIDLRCVEQLVDTEQLMSLAYITEYAAAHLMDGQHSLRQIGEHLAHILKRQGLAGICDRVSLPPNLAMPRKQEILACLNRYRRLNIK